MNALIVAALGVYFLLVGVRGNSQAFLDSLDQDMPGFLPWAVSIGVIVVINEIPATQKLAAPLLFLMVLAFILRNFEAMQTQFKAISQAAGFTGGSTGSF